MIRNGVNAYTKKLESYSMPATLCSKHGWKRKPLNPIFFAPYDIQPGGLTEELKKIKLKIDGIFAEFDARKHD